MASVFVSYSRHRETVIRALVDDISALGHDVWFDEELVGGQVWWDKILENIRLCDIFVFVVDQVSLDSIACKREADYAAMLRKPVLPILTDDDVSTNVLPSSLSRIQLIKYRPQDHSSILGLARAFLELPKATSLTTELPEPPAAPKSYLATLADRVDARTLSLNEQCSLVVDLLQELGKPGTTADTLVLVDRLRNREDLSANIAEQLGQVLNKEMKRHRFRNTGLSVDAVARGRSERYDSAILEGQRQKSEASTVSRLKIGSVLVACAAGIVLVAAIVLGIIKGEYTDVPNLSLSDTSPITPSADEVVTPVEETALVEVTGPLVDLPLAPKESIETESDVVRAVENERWVLFQSPESYTVQIATSRERDYLLELAQNLAVGEGELSIYPFKTDSGDSVYGLLFGLYDSKGEAIAFIESIPEVGKKHGAWIRSISDLQAEIQKR